MASTIDLSGKQALVTGASRGIGRAIAVTLARSGAAVVVNFHTNQTAAEQTVAEIEQQGGAAWAIQANVGLKAEVNRLFRQAQQHFGDRIDILVNNAGGPMERHPLSSMPEEAWDSCINVNLKSVFLCTQAAWSRLPDGTGRVVNVTSISARSGGDPMSVHYAAAKAGMSNFTRCAAKAFGPRQITVNGIAPGVISADIHKYGTPEDELKKLTGLVPLGRVGEAQDCAGAVLFLCSPAAAYITGEIIEINGGMRMD